VKVCCVCKEVADMLMLQITLIDFVMSLVRKFEERGSVSKALSNVGAQWELFEVWGKDFKEFQGSPNSWYWIHYYTISRQSVKNIKIFLLTYLHLHDTFTFRNIFVINTHPSLQLMPSNLTARHYIKQPHQRQNKWSFHVQHRFLTLSCDYYTFRLNYRAIIWPTQELQGYSDQ
jgi:hypothetical protein